MLLYDKPPENCSDVLRERQQLWSGPLAVVSLLQETNTDQDRLYNKSILQHVSSLWGCFAIALLYVALLMYSLFRIPKDLY